jgi:hypothetical protein
MEAALQLRSSALKSEQNDARTLLSAAWKKLEPWGNPQELSGPKFPGRSGPHKKIQYTLFFWTPIDTGLKASKENIQPGSHIACEQA